MIVREYLCRDCGLVFEDASSDPSCPVCSEPEPERVFLTAPAISSEKTRRTDKILGELADTYELSDMSNRYGEPVKKSSSTGLFAPVDLLNRIPIAANARDHFSEIKPLLVLPTRWQKSRAS